MFTLLILLSPKQDPSRNESYNLIKRCKCVEYFWWIVDELLCMIYLSPCVFFSWTWAIYFFFSSFFSTCLVDMWHTFFGYASFIYFCIAHIFDGNLGGRVMIELGVLFCERMVVFAIWWTCMWSWSWEYDKSLTRVKEFDKTQSRVKLQTRVLSWKSNFGLGRKFH